MEEIILTVVFLTQMDFYFLIVYKNLLKFVSFFFWEAKRDFFQQLYLPICIYFVFVIVEYKFYVTPVSSKA